MNYMVQAQGLKKNYGSKEAVLGIDLEVPQGELFVLVGPNGAGKTSILKMIVGLLKPTAGKVLLGGYDISVKPQQAKGILSFVPDMPYVYDKLSPRELLRFVGRLFSMEPQAIEKKGAELLEFFELSDVQDVLIEEFSHGMRQKVVLSASLLHDPKIFILDEPMVGLDPMAIKNLKDFLKQQTRKGMTIIFSTHTLSMAEEMADRIGIIHKGRMIAVGTMEDLRKKYESTENLENMFMRLVKEQLTS